MFFVTASTTQEHEVSSVECNRMNCVEIPRGMISNEAEIRDHHLEIIAPEQRPGFAEKEETPSAYSPRRRLEILTKNLGIVPLQRKRHLSPKKGVVPPPSMHQALPDRLNNARLENDVQALPLEICDQIPTVSVAENVYQADVSGNSTLFAVRMSEEAADAIDGEDSAQKKRRKSSGYKTRFTDYTKSVLEHAYEFNADGAAGRRFLEPGMPRKLSEKCGISQEQVKQWIRNRNKKVRKRCRLSEAQLDMAENGDIAVLDNDSINDDTKEERERPSFTFAH